MSTALHALLQREQMERDRALGALQRTQDALRRTLAQAEQLQQFRLEYQQRWSVQAQGVGDVHALLGYRSFMQRLDEAITQQAAAVQGAQAQVASAQALLVERERQLAAVRKLLERRAAEQQRAMNRREQKEFDEIASRVSAAQAEPTHDALDTSTSPHL